MTVEPKSRGWNPHETGPPLHESASCQDQAESDFEEHQNHPKQKSNPPAKKEGLAMKQSLRMPQLIQTTNQSLGITQLRGGHVTEGDDLNSS